MRRRSLFSKHPIGALYPFENGSRTFAINCDTDVVITNGNHVFIEARSVKSPNNVGEMVNLSHISKNAISSYGPTNSGNINNQPIWFTIPAGVECTTKLLNVSIISGTKVPTMNFRIANASTSVGPSPTLGVNSNSYEANGVLASDTNVGCFFAYIPENMTVEFDIEFYVNGERWI